MITMFTLVRVVVAFVVYVIALPTWLVLAALPIGNGRVGRWHTGFLQSLIDYVDSVD